jgi:hypothetical protein
MNKKDAADVLFPLMRRTYPDTINNTPTEAKEEKYDRDGDHYLTKLLLSGLNCGKCEHEAKCEKKVKVKICKDFETKSMLVKEYPMQKSTDGIYYIKPTFTKKPIDDDNS